MRGIQANLCGVLRHDSCRVSLAQSCEPGLACRKLALNDDLLPCRLPKGALRCCLLQCYCSLGPSDLSKTSQRLLAPNIIDLRLKALRLKSAICRKLLLNRLQLSQGVSLRRSCSRCLGQ
ncbi:hypothetical protein D3C77_257080 [compost metagenome]